MRLIIPILLGLSLSGCGVAAKIQARNAYQKAVDNYNDCLIKNQIKTVKCNAYKQIMLTDEEEYNNFAAGIQYGGTSSLNVNTQN